MIEKHSYEQIHLKVEPKSFLYEFLNSGDPLYLALFFSDSTGPPVRIFWKIVVNQWKFASGTGYPSGIQTFQKST